MPMGSDASTHRVAAGIHPIHTFQGDVTMSIAKIALTAGLLAVQAALLALLHAGEACSATVHQCDGQYQQQPCAAAHGGRVLSFDDTRHPDQVRAAQRRVKRDAELARRSPRSQRLSAQSGPVGLSGHRSGDAPFRNATQVGVGSTLNRMVCHTRHQRLSCHRPDDRLQSAR
jgi:hypothetical protein